ncbi:MAG: transcription antitermination factor NusB [Actinomycetota bacterium]|nr:transcription antitermination factor NusB [Actinomycetota bacterium]
MVKQNARDAAYKILDQYFNKQKPLNSALDNALVGKISRLDKNFAYNVVKGTVRYRIFIDYCISQLSHVSLNQLDREVVTILRLGVFQILYLDKVPYYSIVNESVKLAKKYVHSGAAKFVNAVLRKLSSFEPPQLHMMQLLKGENYHGLKKTSIRYSYPEWLVRYWNDHYGQREAEKLTHSLNGNPYTFLRINPVIDRMQAAKELNLKQGKARSIPGCHGSWLN